MMKVSIDWCNYNKYLTNFFKYAVPIEVGYDPITYRVNENQGSVKLTIRIFSPTPGGAPRPFTLHVTTQDDTASM